MAVRTSILDFPEEFFPVLVGQRVRLIATSTINDRPRVEMLEGYVGDCMAEFFRMYTGKTITGDANCIHDEIVMVCRARGAEFHVVMLDTRVLQNPFTGTDNAKFASFWDDAVDGRGLILPDDFTEDERISATKAFAAGIDRQGAMAKPMINYQGVTRA